MFRYIVCTWDAENDVQHPAITRLKHVVEAAPTWRTAYAERGIYVFCAGGAPHGGGCHHLDQRAGVVLGTIFERPNATTSNTSSPGALLGGATARILASEGRELVNSYWGSYVAVIRGPEARAWILRSPLADLPCFTAAYAGARFFFSDVADCAALGIVPLTTNWSYIARYLIKFTLTHEQTGLTGVTEIRGGHCAELRRGVMERKVYWDPGIIATSDPIHDVNAAKETIRSVTKACVHAWASGHERILHRLSGGLDSSIVLGCLKDSPSHATVTCVNYSSFGDDSDELEFARISAQDARCELIEYRRTHAIDFRDALRARLSEAPQRYLSGLATASIERELARSLRVTATFSGSRGDEIFLRNPKFAAADYIFDHGIDAGLYQKLLFKAEHENISLWRAATHALRNGFFAREWDLLQEWGRLHGLVSDDLLSTIRAEVSSVPRGPQSSARVPMGKQYQILGVAEPERLYKPFTEAGDPVPVVPLMSQPLVESCLRIPTYILAHGGWDRAIARQAFVDDVPGQILRRRTKGSVTEGTSQIFHRNLDFAREMLLDGALVQHGLLDRSKLTEALSTGPSRRLKNLAQIFRYLNAEIWLALWNRPMRASIAA